MASKLILFILLNITAAYAVITDAELNLAILTLRAHNYNLIGNAIATTDLRYKLLSSSVSSFTILSPPDAALYSLDMASPASAYVQSLHYHLLPTRLPFSDLLNASRAHTFLPNFDLFFSRLNGSVFVNGVSLVVPDLFLGPDIAVHALDGVLVPGELGFDAADAASASSNFTLSPPPIPSPPSSVQSSPPSPSPNQVPPPQSPSAVQLSPPPPSIQLSPPPPPSVQSSPPPPPTNHDSTPPSARITLPSNGQKNTPPPQSHPQMTPEIQRRRRRGQTGKSQGRRRPGPGRNGELSKANAHFPDL